MFKIKLINAGKMVDRLVKVMNKQIDGEQLKQLAKSR